MFMLESLLQKDEEVKWMDYIRKVPQHSNMLFYETKKILNMIFAIGNCGMCLKSLNLISSLIERMNTVHFLFLIGIT